MLKRQEVVLSRSLAILAGKHISKLSGHSKLFCCSGHSASADVIPALALPSMGACAMDDIFEGGWHRRHLDRTVHLQLRG